MATNENSRLEYESGVTPFPMQAITDSGDHLVFTTGASLFSETSGNAPVIRPNGLLTGGAVIPGISASDDVVDIATSSSNLAGVVTAVTAVTDLAVVRASSDVASISSITITSGGSYTVVIGVDSSDTTFSEVRGAAGGPPLVPADSIEIAQIRTTTNTAGPIATTEVFDTTGTHKETAGFPVFSVDNVNASISFDSALPLSHTGAVSKAVYASYADAVFTEQTFGNDFVPAETTHSTSSEQVYGATIGSSSTSLDQGSFTAILTDGITDAILSRKNETLWFKYFQDKFKTPHILTQGKLGLSRTFNASDNPKVSCTVSATVESTERT